MKIWVKLVNYIPAPPPLRSILQVQLGEVRQIDDARDQLGHFANRDRLALVSDRESTELGVIGEAFDTDRGSGLDERNDLLTWGRRCQWERGEEMNGTYPSWRTAGACETSCQSSCRSNAAVPRRERQLQPATTTIGTHTQVDLLCKSVDVHDGTVTRANNILVVEDDELGLKVRDGVDGSLDGRENESDSDLFVFDSTETDADVVSAHGHRNFLLHLVVDGSNDDSALWIEG